MAAAIEDSEIVSIGEAIIGTSSHVPFPKSDEISISWRDAMSEY
jgi:hypothetical protein